MSKPIVERIRDIVREMERGDYSEADLVTVITRDKCTGTITISSLTEKGGDATHQLFREMAKNLGYARIQ